MIMDFSLPELGPDIQEGTIVEWHKEAGNAVEIGEILLEVMTEKVNVEVESYMSGMVVEILYPKDAEVKVGDVIARIEEKH